MSSNNSSSYPSNDGGVRRSSPIPIANPGSAFNRAGRGRSASVSSGSSGSMSPTSPSELPTPLSGLSPRITVPSPGSSPILSYFLPQSPTKSQSNATFPFRKFGPPVFEEDESQTVPHATHHARRASVTVADRFSQPNNATALPDSHMERGAGLLRRLSLSTGPSAFGKPLSPEAPPNTATSPTAPSLPYARDAKPRRSMTVSSSRPPRAPSPMGERILKGHFDGFN